MKMNRIGGLLSEPQLNPGFIKALALIPKRLVFKKSRREFLKAAGVTGAAAGTAAVVLSENKAQAAKPDGGQKAGYRETEHVKTYYELARF